ncbi:1-acyl-sn-glycerol-3-phosphate acyltransferase [Nocardioides mangrovicus]|uniref:1-acyl-sn-glycerol-3-phosphate acyltransferase n=1 Tax=Nocardioides mangrovicus TaxID=2478913 RepID=A0A3L8P6M3_9ACTN|nr:lysophospholipid acyltransferase family protein [Nocardioides mangrovicus]RLV50607.1 1-acyl-sn-glycerol-3-phosphate acyltransferase [Nocardioides mangrovicus]
MDVTYRLANALGRGVLGALGVDVRLHGVERIPEHGPVLLAANHCSFLDFVTVERAAIERGRFVRFLTRHDMWVPGVGAAMDAMRHVPVDRQAPAAAYLTARRLLREGEAVGVFPEAGLSHAFTIRSMMPGVAALSRETGTTVVPLAQWGAQRITTAGDPTRRPDLTRGRVVDVSVGPPFTVPADGDLRDWTAYLGEVLTGLLEELQRLPHHRPRPHEHAPWHPAHLGGQAPTLARAAELDDPPFSAIAPTWGPAARAPGGSATAPAAPRASTATAAASASPRDRPGR